MVVYSAGALLFRSDGHGRVEVLLGHPGGPFFARRDDGAWSIPKGERNPDEEPRAAAAREFAEELGSPLPPGRQFELGTVRLPSGKRLTVYAVEADFDAGGVRSNTFEMEWPPKSGRTRSFPEIDRAAWFDLATARVKLARGQAEFLDRLLAAVEAGQRA
ncbi:MAG: NUDIX domain-containing protein [Pseudonocardia sp.]|nr:NUDIX domain-containing protein [Pseudonocardia sp.]MBO0876975.1 NUDIX domain-containing protein [Pseudonocardia sp.]